METLSYGDSALSLVVPAAAIGLALLTRRVPLALGVGILLGALLLTSFHPVQALGLTMTPYKP